MSPRCPRRAPPLREPHTQPASTCPAERLRSDTRRGTSNPTCLNSQTWTVTGQKTSTAEVTAPSPSFLKPKARDASRVPYTLTHTLTHAHPAPASSPAPQRSPQAGVTAVTSCLHCVRTWCSPNEDCPRASLERQLEPHAQGLALAGRPVLVPTVLSLPTPRLLPSPRGSARSSRRLPSASTRGRLLPGIVISAKTSPPHRGPVTLHPSQGFTCPQSTTAGHLHARRPVCVLPPASDGRATCLGRPGP